MKRFQWSSWLCTMNRRLEVTPLKPSLSVWSFSSPSSHIYVWSVYDDIRCHDARSCAFSPDHPFPLRSALTTNSSLASLPSSSPALLSPSLSFLQNPLLFSPHPLTISFFTFFEISPTFIVSLIPPFFILPSFVRINRIRGALKCRKSLFYLLYYVLW